MFGTCIFYLLDPDCCCCCCAAAALPVLLLCCCCTAVPQPRHNLLSAWCECLTNIQMNIKARWASADVEQEFEKLLEAEALLLQQLPTNPSASQMQDAAAVLNVGVDTIAPPGDPMAYFQHHISQPPMANATTITLQGMGELMRDCTLQLSVQLHITKNSVSEQHAVAMEQLREGLDR